MRTSEAVSPNITAAAGMPSLITYALGLAVIGGAGIWYLLKMIRRGPHPDETPPEHGGGQTAARPLRSEEHTSELQSLMRISYAVFCLKKKITANHSLLYYYLILGIKLDLKSTRHKYSHSNA